MDDEEDNFPVPNDSLVPTEALVFDELSLLSLSGTSPSEIPIVSDAASTTSNVAFPNASSYDVTTTAPRLIPFHSDDLSTSAIYGNITDGHSSTMSSSPTSSVYSMSMTMGQILPERKLGEFQVIDEPDELDDFEIITGEADTVSRRRMTRYDDPHWTVNDWKQEKYGWKFWNY